MIEEENFGFRDKRGHFVPKEATDKNPVWVLPLNFKKILSWFIFSYIFSWNLVYLIFAFIAYYFFTPPLSEMKSFAPGWMSEILLRNYVIGTIFFSLIHIPLYISKSQGIKFKFNPKDLIAEQGTGSTISIKNQVTDGYVFQNVATSNLWKETSQSTNWGNLGEINTFLEAPIYTGTAISQINDITLKDCR